MIQALAGLPSSVLRPLSSVFWPLPSVTAASILKGLHHSAQRWTARGRRGGGPTLGKLKELHLGSNGCLNGSARTSAAPCGTSDAANAATGTVNCNAAALK